MKMWENKYRETKICVDSYDHRILKGRLYNLFSETPIVFNSTMEFLVQMDALMNEMELPQPFLEMRSFPCPKPTEVLARAAKETPGSVCTFIIRVMFRQNASWQGRLTWTNEKREESFRSVLELLFLIDNTAYSDYACDENPGKTE